MHPQFAKTFEEYVVPEEIKEALWNYFSYGLDPGGFCMAVLQNNFANAICRAHRSLSAECLRSISMWLMAYGPSYSYGSIEDITSWMRKTDIARRDIMIENFLRPSEFDILRGHAVA